MRKAWLSGAAIFLIASSSGICAQETVGVVTTPETVVAHWPAVTKKKALALIEKYGEPDTFGDAYLVWHGNGPWKRSTLRRAGQLEQVIGYEVPADREADLDRFDPRLKVDRKKRELSMRTDSEGMNFLVLNLADEVVARWKTVEEAHAFSGKAVNLAAEGKTSTYMDGLRFKIDRGPGAPLKR